MAIKFFKVLGGLSKLFNKSNKKDDFSNLTTAASNKGINENSIVHVTATSDDTGSFGARYLPDTSVLYVNGQPHIDSKNILFGISMQVYSNIPVFIAPKGLLKATDTVKVARIRKTNASGKNSHGADSIGLTIPDQDLGITLKKYAGDTAESSNMEKWAFCVSTSYLNISELSLLLNTQSKAGAILTDSKIAFSIWRNQVQVSDWFQWYFDGSQLKVEKGLYLPGVQEIKYEDLLAKAKSEKLVPGRRYCITDYCPTSVRSDLVNAGVQNKGLYLTALTKNTLSEDGILVYGDQQCEVKYGLKKNRWSTEWTFSENAEVNDGGNFNIEATGQRMELTWKVISKNSVPDDNKSVVIDFGLEEPLLWIHTHVDNSDSVIAGIDLYAAIQQSDLYPNDSITAYCYEPTTLGLAIQFLIDIDPQYLIPFYTNTYKGEVYWMRDPYNNEATYDFKGYKVKVGNINFWTFSDSNENDGSRNGKCTNNRILYEGYYNVFAPDVHNLVLNTKYDIQQIDTGTSITFNNKIFANGYIIPEGTSSEFLMANGSTLKGIDATATKLDASADPTVNFNNSTFNFGIPSGQDGSKWYSGTAITGTNTTGTKFTSSGITAALARDKYLNTSNSNIYECVIGGNASTATWKYIGNIKGDTGSVANIEDGTSGEVVTGLTLSNGTITMNKGSVGGRNLLLGSRVPSFGQWTGQIEKYESKDEYYQITSKGKDNISFYWNAFDNLTVKELKGNYITISGFVKTDVDDKVKIGIVFQKSAGDTTAMGSYYTTASYFNINSGEWTRIHSTFKCEHNLDETFTDSNNATYKIGASCIVIASTNPTVTKTVYQVKQFKLEFGSVPTDWSVAPEEGDLYNNSAYPTITVGGIGPDTNLENKTMKEMFDLLLYPVVAFKDLYVQVSPSSFEYNTKPNSITYTARFTAGSKDVSYIWDNDKTKTSNSITITPTAKLTSGPRHSVTVSDISAGGTTTLSASGAPGITYRWFFGLGTETTPALGTVGSLGTSVTKRDYPLQGNTTNYKVWLLYPNITGWTMPTILNMGAPFNDYAEINGVTYNGLSYKAFKFNPEYKAGETKFTLQ